ncbi:unnamed protein product [marine sediment metagenome]|uniref:Uncharacterized protein n=1 Tax=marine sediment metagenome TaxID=412755 RepID=X0V2Y1_9ZZZZ
MLIGLAITLNFECKTYQDHFDSDVGKITFGKKLPKFEEKTFCKHYGERAVDEVYLTEVGQDQL